MSPEAYAHERDGVRAEITAHRLDRTVRVGRHARLVFEDERTVRYQIQELLHVEGICGETEIQAEIDAYAPLIPDGSNLKATLLVEFPDEDARGARLAQLADVESRVWVQVDGSSRVFGIADEDIERADADTTAAVHFLRFELARPMVRGLAQGSRLSVGIDHPAYTAGLVVRENVRRSLLNDLRRE